jgi:hypothetical protein
VSNIPVTLIATVVDSPRWQPMPTNPPRVPRFEADSVSVRLCHFRRDAVIDVPGNADHRLYFVVGRPAVFELRDCGKTVRETYQPGEGRIVPTGVPVSFRLVGASITAHLCLNAAWFAEAAAAEFGFHADHICVMERRRLRDAFLWVLVAGLLRRSHILPPLDPLVRDAVALGLACYLIREHSSAAEPLANTTAKRERALVSDFIDDIVAGELGLPELARDIGVAEGELIACFSDGDAPRLRMHLERAHARRAAGLVPSVAKPEQRAGGRLRLISALDFDITPFPVFGCVPDEHKQLPILI